MPTPRMRRGNRLSHFRACTASWSVARCSTRTTMTWPRPSTSPPPSSTAADGATAPQQASSFASEGNTMTNTTEAPALAGTGSALPVVSHWIDGAEYPSASGRTAPVYNPALGIEAKRVALADQAEIDAAIASAQRRFEVWSRYSIAKRQAVLFAFRELLNSRKNELAEIITSEHGKVLSDALGEINRGQEVVELATGFPHLTKGAFSESASTGIDVYSIRQPLGVVGIISPFNFPAMVPMWFFPVAIAAGNAVVLKPSEKDPSA